LRALAVAAVMLLGACAHVPAEQRGTSLFLAEWRDVRNVRLPPGCNVPEVICWNVWADVDFGNVSTVSGPRLPTAITATVGFHAQPRRSVTILAAVRTDAAGKRTAWRLDVVLPTESEACFDADDVDRLNIVVPKVAVRRGDQYCVSVI